MAEQQNMTTCIHASSFSRRRKLRQDKWQRRLQQLEQMRAAKDRKRQERIAAGWEPEPKMVRAFRFEFGVRDKTTGETHFTDLKSVRHAAKALGLVLKHL